ncbi:MAG TPA: type II toxin-antitoxin system VapC family toxin [Bryobacteraceae bacterium]|jgi:predicted nucleic acid-binding protein|nr:type II toxin-antitoxin system VapC family toxin [Bryobacteraceae bacterium]
MTEFVLDASVAISWCFPGDLTENTAYSRRVLSELTLRDAIVPEIWAFEIANTIFVSFTKRKRITEPQIREYLGRLKALPIKVEYSSLWANVELESYARKSGVSAYDVAYLDLALRKHLPLATSDAHLVAAAVAEGIEVLK